MIDLHIHSKYSFDGEMSLEEILEVSKKLDVNVISLTDHDNIDGLRSFLELAKEYNIKAVPGVEVSTVLNQTLEGIPFDASIHILGYNFNHQDNRFQDELKKIEKLDRDRLNNIGNYLVNNRNMKLSYKFYNSKFDLLNDLIDNGNCEDIKQAKNLINSDDIRKIYPPVNLSTLEAIELIRKYNGIPVLAHPYEGTGKILYNDIQVKILVKKMVELGIEGIETHHYLHLEDNRINKLWKLAEKFNLLKTVGSDCHSHNKNYGEVTSLDSRKKVLDSSINYSFKDFLELFIVPHERKL